LVYVRPGFALKINLGGSPFKYGPPPQSGHDPADPCLWPDDSDDDAEKVSIPATPSVGFAPYRNVLSGLVRLRPRVALDQDGTPEEVMSALVQDLGQGTPPRACSGAGANALDVQVTSGLRSISGPSSRMVDFRSLVNA